MTAPDKSALKAAAEVCHACGRPKSSAVTPYMGVEPMGSCAYHLSEVFFANCQAHQIRNLRAENARQLTELQQLYSGVEAIEETRRALMTHIEAKARMLNAERDAGERGHLEQAARILRNGEIGFDDEPCLDGEYNATLSDWLEAERGRKGGT